MLAASSWDTDSVIDEYEQKAISISISSETARVRTKTYMGFDPNAAAQVRS